MHSSKHYKLFATLALAALALAAPHRAAAQTTTYTITDLGALGHNGQNNYSIAYGINASGQASGVSSSSSSIITGPAALFSGGTVTNLGTLGGATGIATGINSSAQMTGYSTHADGSYGAFLFSNGKMTDIGNLGAGYAVGYGINDSAEIVGQSTNSAGGQHAFLFSNGKMTDLGTLPGGTYSQANGINNAGSIVGYSYTTDGQGGFLGFTMKPGGKMVPVGTLGGPWSIAYAVNNLNQITGQGYTASSLAHAFLLRNSSKLNNLIDLGELEQFGASWGLSINDSATVVGFATRRGVYVAFVSFNGKPMLDLNTLIPAKSGWVLEFARGINNAGQIAGEGLLNGVTRAFLLTPVK